MCIRDSPARYCNRITIDNLAVDLSVDDACTSMGTDSIHHTYPGSCKVRENTVRSGKVRDHFFHEGFPVSLPLGENRREHDTDLSVVPVFANSMSDLMDPADVIYQCVLCRHHCQHKWGLTRHYALQHRYELCRDGSLRYVACSEEYARLCARMRRGQQHRSQSEVDVGEPSSRRAQTSSTLRTSRRWRSPHQRDDQTSQNRCTSPQNDEGPMPSSSTSQLDDFRATDGRSLRECQVVLEPLSADSKFSGHDRRRRGNCRDSSDGRAIRGAV